MIRTSIVAMLLAGIASGASAELRSDDESLTRCGVDFDVAYQLIVPEPAAGETEEQAIAKLAPDMAHLANVLNQWSQRTNREIVLSSTHLTSDDSRKLAAVEKAEEDELVNRLNGDKSNQDAVFDDVMGRANDCANKFFPEQ